MEGALGNAEIVFQFYKFCTICKAMTPSHLHYRQANISFSDEIFANLRCRVMLSFKNCLLRVYENIHLDFALNVFNFQ